MIPSVSYLRERKKKKTMHANVTTFSVLVESSKLTQCLASRGCVDHTIKHWSGIKMTYMFIALMQGTVSIK